MDCRETLPKSGHVHEVCKEWLVREDGALAYRLQSQEINEYYQGNKFRNAVVRRDFPTALLEQIKERETAEQERVREEADKCLAETIAKNLENDEQLHSVEQRKNKLVVKQLQQETYVNCHYLPKSTSHSLCTLNNPVPENERKPLVSSDFSDNLICDLEKLHCRPRANIIEQDYEQYIDVVHNIRNADILQTQVNNCHQLNSIKNHQEGAEKIELVDNNDFWSEVDVASRKYTKSQGANKANWNHAIAAEIPTQLDEPLEYVDSNCPGLSSKNFAELHKKLEQEKSDEELARYLQKEEQRCNLSQEEKDRLLAIEAQDKELAIMLQDREKLKAKRAKEKARLKKLHAKEALTENSKIHAVNEPYSNPKDLITGSQEFKLNLKETNYISSATQHIKFNRNNYNTNGEDIYTLPIDNAKNEVELKSQEEMNTNISTSRTVLSSPSSVPAIYCQPGTESCSKPPYMPIHDSGNNLSLERKKKKSKDKCTHQ